MFKWLCVRIPALDSEWTFFILICRECCIIELKRRKIKQKEVGVGPF